MPTARSTAALSADWPSPIEPSLPGMRIDGRSGATLELAYLVLKLRGEIFFDIDYGVIFIFAGEAAQDMSGFGGVRGGIGLQPERTEADDGVSAANNSDFKHTYHAAFLVSAPGRCPRACR